jgi:hypothetical protein
MSSSKNDFLTKVAGASGNPADRPIGPPESIVIYHHMVAMLLLMTMQSSGGTFPNIDFVAGNPFGTKPANAGYLQELFPKIRQDVYESIRGALNSGAGQAPYTLVTAGFAGIVQGISANLGVQLWCGSYPHDPNTAVLVNTLLS